MSKWHKIEYKSVDISECKKLVESMEFKDRVKVTYDRNANIYWGDVTIKFKNEKDMFWFNMTVEPPESLISFTANDIIGVQPMTAPAGQIFTLRARYREDD